MATIWLCCLVVVVGPGWSFAAEPGDINGDGSINPADVFYLVKHLSGHGPAPIGDADFNHDGSISEADIDALTSFLFETAPLMAATVGPAGGELSSDGFKLEIPSGVLSSEREISVTVGAVPAGFPDASSLRYSLHGLPAELSSNIKVVLPVFEARQLYPRTLEATIMPYTIVRGPMLSPSRVKTVLADYFFEGVQTAKEVAAQIGNAGRWLGDKIELFSVRRARLISPKNKFEIMVALDEWPKYKEDLTILATFLDGLHETIAHTLGLPWDLVLSPRIRVVFSSDPTKEGEALSSNWNTYLDYLLVSKRYFHEGLTPGFMATLAHEVTHLLTNQWDPRWSAHRRNLSDWWYQGNEYLWWNEAVSTWAEEKFGFAGSCPVGNAINPGAPFEGLYIPGLGRSETQDHGYGLASLVKYMADIGTPKIIGNIYKDMRDYWFWNNGKYAIEAVLDAMGSGDRNNLNWWSHYYLALLQGSIYPELTTHLRSYFKDKALAGTLGNASHLNSLSTIIAVRDLSAKPFLVTISGGAPLESTNRATFAALKIMPVGSDGYLSDAPDAGIMVFKNPGRNAFEYLAGAHDQAVVTIGDLTDGMQLLVLLLNARHVAPYNVKTNLEFQANLGNTHFTADAGTVSFEGWIYGAENMWYQGYNSDAKAANFGVILPPVGETATLDVIMRINTCNPSTTYNVQLNVLDAEKTVSMGCDPMQTALTGERTNEEQQISVSVWTDNIEGQLVAGEPWY